MPTDSPSPTEESASQPNHWQFRLWHLFAVMSYVAVVAGVARWWGIETLAVSLGLGIAWLNYCGWLSYFQRGKPQLATLGIAWGMFLTSLFLPVDTFWAPQGYVAAWFVLSAPVDLVWRQRWLELIKVLCWIPLIDAANLLQFLLPVTAVRLQWGRGKYLVAVHCVSMVAVWILANAQSASGYILWCASFLVTLIAFPLSRPTLIAMHFALAVLFILVWTIREW